MGKLFNNMDELNELMNHFESGEMSPLDFNHHRHMSVAMVYVSQSTEAEALEKLRHRLKSYLKRALAHHPNLEKQHKHHGEHEHGQKHPKQQGYNETLTLFWIKLLGHVLNNRPDDEPLFESINHAIDCFGTMKPVFVHYSPDRVFSEEAKKNWVEPDLVPLNF
jgi:hypothetical protein